MTAIREWWIECSNLARNQRLLIITALDTPTPNTDRYIATKFLDAAAASLESLVAQHIFPSLKTKP